MLRLHEDVELFRQAVEYTAAETGFRPHLIEKDYFCSALLQYLSSNSDLIFKGGTCLAKVHLDFVRMSEDLDFALSAAGTLTRKQRSQLARPFKEAVRKIK